MSTPADSKVAANASVNRLVPFAHVVDVQASMTFYAHLGFSPVSVLRHGAQPPFWARLSSGSAEIMFARASGPIDADQQAVLFYMYTADVEGLRRHLLAQGLRDGGVFCGQPGPGDGRRVAFEITRPDYMPAGEMRLHDPDGYCILVGQLG